MFSFSFHTNLLELASLLEIKKTDFERKVLPEFDINLRFRI